MRKRESTVLINHVLRFSHHALPSEGAAIVVATTRSGTHESGSSFLSASRNGDGGKTVAFLKATGDLGEIAIFEADGHFNIFCADTTIGVGLDPIDVVRDQLLGRR